MGGKHSFGLDVLKKAECFDIQPVAVTLQVFLRNSLDRGEAAVIQPAMNLNYPLPVCIDQAVGRRAARLFLQPATFTS